MEEVQKEVEFRILHSSDDGWYWEVIADTKIVGAGLADTQTAAARDANNAARKAKLIQ
jgi:hypothetical protein